MSTVVVFGGTGFLGRRLVHHGFNGAVDRDLLVIPLAFSNRVVERRHRRTVS